MLLIMPVFNLTITVLLNVTYSWQPRCKELQATSFSYRLINFCCSGDITKTTSGLLISDTQPSGSSQGSRCLYQDQEKDLLPVKAVAGEWLLLLPWTCCPLVFLALLSASCSAVTVLSVRVEEQNSTH